MIKKSFRKLSQCNIRFSNGQCAFKCSDFFERSVANSTTNTYKIM